MLLISFLLTHVYAISFLLIVSITYRMLLLVDSR